MVILFRISGSIKQKSISNIDIFSIDTFKKINNKNIKIEYKKIFSIMPENANCA